MLTHLITQRSPSLTHFPTSATPSLHSHLSSPYSHTSTSHLPLYAHSPKSPLHFPTHLTSLLLPSTHPYPSLSLLFPLPNSPYLCSVTSPLIHLSSRSPYSPPPLFTLRQPLFYFTSFTYLYRQHLHLSFTPISPPLTPSSQLHPHLHPSSYSLHTFHVLTLPLLSSYLSHLPPLLSHLSTYPPFTPSSHFFPCPCSLSGNTCR